MGMGVSNGGGGQAVPPPPVTDAQKTGQEGHARLLPTNIFKGGHNIKCPPPPPHPRFWGLYDNYSLK